MDMLYKCKDVFSLSEEIGTCLNVEVEIDVTDKSTFLLGCIMLKSKRRIYWTRDEKIVLSRYIKGRVFSIFESYYVDK